MTPRLMSFSRLKESNGVSLMEVIMYLSLFAMLTGVVTTFVRSTLNGFTSAEAHSTIIKCGQEASDRIAHELAVSRRIFDAGAANFRTRVDLSSAPAVLTGSQLATIEENGSLSPGSASFVTGGVGNTLFLAQSLGEEDVAGGTRTYRIDVYRFDYFYLTQQPGQTLGAQAKLTLEEWRSVSYGSAPELLNITDASAAVQVINALRAAGIAYACDLTQSDPSSAFYALGPGTITAQPTHQIPMGTTVGMLQLIASITGGAFRYGISPNSSAAFAPPDVVPLYARASGQFPSGFEVVIAGPPSARQVLTRIVIAAQGSMPTPLSHQQVSVVTVDDSW